MIPGRWSSRDCLDTLSHVPVSSLDLIGAHATQVTVTTDWIVEGLDVFGYICEAGGRRVEARRLERVMGIEPTLVAWEATVLPLNYTRNTG